MSKNKELSKEAQESKKLRQIIKNVQWMSNDMKRKIPEIESIMSNE